MVSVNQVKNFYLVKKVLVGGTYPVYDEAPLEAPSGDIACINGEMKEADGSDWDAAAANGIYLLEDGKVAEVSSGTTTLGNPTVGMIQVVPTVDGKVMLYYYGKGGWIKSDYIDPEQLIYTQAHKAEDFLAPLKEATITLDSNVNGGQPVAGEDYIVNILVSNYIALGDNNTLLKFGAVRVTTGMTDSDFYKELAKSFVRNFSRDINHFFKFYLTTSGSDVEVKSGKQDLSAVTATGVKVVELSQAADYVRGEFPVTRVNFQISPEHIVVNGDEVYGITVDDDGTVALTDSASEFLPNSYEIADTEFFCAGERGDQYRQVNYPRTIRTKYLIDVDNMPADGYDVLDLAFYFVGRGISRQHSDKHILCVAEGSGSSYSQAMQDLISALQTALSITIPNS